MEPKEKAKLIFDKYRRLARISSGTGDSVPTTKQCALICVDEIIQDRQLTVIGKAIHPRTKYWNEVKQEIELL